jgi:hypothetical protein
MDILFQEFSNQFQDRISHFKNFNSFGEDSIRYDFFNSVIQTFNLRPYELLLEYPIPNSQFEQKTLKQESGRGRHEYKPEVDLLIHPTKELRNGLIAEFAYFRKPEKATNQDKTGKHGKILNEVFRLSLMKHHTSFRNYNCYLICVTDSEMINYGKPGSRGSAPIGILDEYQLDEYFLQSLKSTALGKIDRKFINKANQLNITPIAKRTTIKSSNFNWEIWIWEVNFIEKT